MRFGRIFKGVVVSVTVPPTGSTLEQHVGSDQAENYEPVPDHVGVGYKQQFDGTWVEPTPAIP